MVPERLDLFHIADSAADALALADADAELNGGDVAGMSSADAELDDGDAAGVSSASSLIGTSTTSILSKVSFAGPSAGGDAGGGGDAVWDCLLLDGTGDDVAAGRGFNAENLATITSSDCDAGWDVVMLDGPGNDPTDASGCDAGWDVLILDGPGNDPTDASGCDGGWDVLILDGPGNDPSDAPLGCEGVPDGFDAAIFICRNMACSPSKCSAAFSACSLHW